MITRGKGVIAAAVTVAGCAAPSQTAATTVTVTPTLQPTITSTETVTYTPPPPPGPSTMIASDGTFRVGADIQPGTYATKGPNSGQTFGDWSRLRDLNRNGISSTLAAGNEPGPAYVTIEPTDVAFKTEFCQPWTRMS